MITCPNCGQGSREGQRFCGSCGFDIQSAPAPQPRSMAVSEQPSPYAYQPTNPYGLDSRPSAGLNGARSPAMRFVIIGAIVLIAACCVFACGLGSGWFIGVEVLGGSASPTPARGTRTPVPFSTLPLILYYFYSVWKSKTA